MERKNALNKAFSPFLCLVVVMSILLTFCACQAENGENSASDGKPVSFTLKVIDREGNETETEITTSEKTVGAALKKEGIIDGEQGPYGIYIKSVNGIKADYDEDKTFWAFYIDGEFASVGVDSAEIKPGSVYTLKVQK